MLAPRWEKVLKDLWSNKARTILVVLSIAVGVFAAGFVTNGYIILSQDMNADFRAAKPHSAVIYPIPFKDDLLDAVRHVPGVAAAEGRSVMNANVITGEEKTAPIQITAIPVNPEEMEVDLIHIMSQDPSIYRNGKITLGKEQIFIEQTSSPVLNVKPGEKVTLILPGDRRRELVVTALVHDVSAYSSIFSGSATAYVSPETMEWLGGSSYYDQLLIRVSGDATDEKYVNEITAAAANKIEKSGNQVFATVVFHPGEHPIYFLIQPLMFLLGALGSLAIFLSAFLVVNTINALLSQHTRQIGIMKAIGARAGQILWMYVVLIGGFGFMAWLVAFPLAGLTSYAMIQLLSPAINFMPQPFRIPAETIILEIMIALIVPVTATFFPVWNGTRQTVREALSNYGLGRGRFGKNWFDRALEKIKGAPRPLLISLRNTFRRKARLMLTLSTLTLGGAIFIAVFNVQASFMFTIDETLGYFLSDINLDLNQSKRVEQIKEIVTSIPEISRLEPWGVSSGKVLFDNKSTAINAILWAPPANSQLIKPVITAGRWLVPEDENAIVVGNHMLNQRPDIKIGDELIIQIGKREFSWKVVGFFRLAGNVIPPFLYVNNDYLSKIINTIGDAYTYRIVTVSQDPATENQAALKLKEKLKEAGVDVGSITTGVENRAQQASQINILIYFLLGMAVLIALVGGLGLMGTMSMNVLERTREIGVMRSIGARNHDILNIVLAEGMLIGLISWVLGTLLAFPLSELLNNGVGVAFVGTPLKSMFSLNGFIIWFILVIVISGVASFIPAMNAMRLTIRDVLAYE